MAGWSILDDKSDSDYIKTLHKIQKIGLGLTIDSSLETCPESGNSKKLRCSFDKFLSAFLKHISSSTCFRPQPPMLGDGKSVDLFKLFLIVKQKGGHGAVCRNGLWGLVAKESGLDSGFESALKLIYVKYLDSLDQWLVRVFRDNSGVEDSSGDRLGGISMDLEREFKDFLSDNLDQKKKDEKCPQVDLKKDGFRYLSALDLDCLDEVKGEVLDDKSEVKNGPRVEPELVISSYSYDEDDTYPHSEGELETEAGSELALDRHDTLGNDDEDFASRKRKHESNTALIGWLYEVARDPCDPAIGTMPERSKLKPYGDEELWKQVLLVRQTLFLKDIKSSAERSIWKKKQKMHPSIYEAQNGLAGRFTGTLRRSPRLFPAKKPKQHSCLGSSSLDTQRDLDASPSLGSAGKENHVQKRLLGKTCLLTTPGFGSRYKCVPVGPGFQAEVPTWTGVPSESDSKWLGTKIWPPQVKLGNRFLIEREHVGKGRQDSCGCPLQGSIDCIRFHVAERRKRLKLELGSTFQDWKFNQMGEEVAQTWTGEDQKKFTAIVGPNPLSIEKYFWSGIYKSFPRKSREELVSYYFNVFLLNRRGHQNRFAPDEINSDDDDDD